MKSRTETISGENSRIRDVYRKRELEIDKDLYAPWQPAENFIVSERKRTAASLLHEAGKFPAAGDKCLEIGYGKLGWLADLISWGVKETDLYGIELDAARASIAQKALPNAELLTGDATALPWNNETFRLVIVSTVFSSILEDEVRLLIADEISRVLVKGGAVIWYDLAVNNPKNPNVKGIKSEQLKKLFPAFEIKSRKVTLAPPLARAIAPKSFALASVINLMPFLRTHFLSLLIKN